MEAAISAPARQPHLLLVEDDQFLAAMLRAVAEACGWHVTMAHDSGQIAADLEPPTLVLLDMQLGAEDGFPLIERLALSYSVPVVAMSANPASLDRARTSPHTVEALLKPIDLDDLKRMLARSAA